MLIKGQDKQSRVPLWGVANGFVDALDKGLAQVNGRRWVKRLIRATNSIGYC